MREIESADLPLFEGLPVRFESSVRGVPSGCHPVYLLKITPAWKPPERSGKPLVFSRQAVHMYVRYTYADQGLMELDSSGRICQAGSLASS